MLNYVSHALQPERKPTQYKQPRPDRLADQAKPVGEAKWGLPRLAPVKGGTRNEIIHRWQKHRRSVGYNNIHITIQGHPFNRLNITGNRKTVCFLYDKVHTVFVRGGFYPNIVQEAYEWQTIVSLVEANLGVSICPASFQKLLIGKVQYRPF